MAKRNPQLELLKKESKSYGGELRRTRAGRQGARPLAVRSTMHLVLRSTKAKGSWSFQKHDKKVRGIVKNFALKHGVKVLSLANVGNHLHFHIRLGHRKAWRPFIRAITASIAMAVTGKNRWQKDNFEAKNKENREERHERDRGKFWDYRPFTRVIQSWKEFLNLKDYIKINHLEGLGHHRTKARWVIKNTYTNSA